MRQNVFRVSSILVMFWASTSTAAEVKVGFTATSGDVGAFDLAISNHYHVSKERLVLLRKKKVRDEDLPVLFHVAAQARVSPEVVAGLRLKGKSWMDITTHFGLNAGVFYVPITGRYGPPYGNAFGHYKNKKKSEWGRIRLTDAEIVHLANVKFLAAHHGVSADAVVQMRLKGDSYARLNARIKLKKGGKGGKQPKAAVGKKRASATKAQGKGGGGRRGKTTSRKQHRFSLQTHSRKGGGGGGGGRKGGKR